MPIVLPPPKISERAYVTNGLADQDDNIDILEGYFKEMQRTTVETSQLDDFLAFATCAHFFGVIMLETTTTPVAEEYVSDEETDAELAPKALPEEPEESVYPTSSRATSPPMSVAWSTTDQESTQRLQTLREAARTSPTEALFPTLSEEDKVLIWREAFMEQIEEDSNNDPNPLASVHEEPGVIPIYSRENMFPDLDHPMDNVPFFDPLYGRHEQVDGDSDFINWPDEGPPNGDGHSAHKPDQTPKHKHHIFIPSSVGMSPFVSYSQEEIGREYLEPEVFNSPVKELVDLPQDPAMQEIIYQSAINHQKSLREKRVKDFLTAERRKHMTKQRPLRSPGTPSRRTAPIGLVYLWTSQSFTDPLHRGECSLGVYIDPKHRGKDCLTDPINQVVERAFKDPDCHRIQSIMVENPDKLYLLDLLARTGFHNEGIHRHAFYSAIAHEWKDVTYFAMVVTEWVYDTNNNGMSSTRLRPTSLWDEVFSRHQRECDDLIRLEERSTLKRSISIETIREKVSSSLSFTESIRDEDTTDNASSINSSPNKRQRTRKWRSDSRKSQSVSASAASISSGIDSEWEDARSVISTSSAIFPLSSAASSVAGPSRPRKKFSIASGSVSDSSSSQWDVV